MLVLALISGVILGVALSILVLILVRKNEPTIQKILNHSRLSPSVGDAYIAGLSEEESTFRASLPLDKQVEIL